MVKCLNPECNNTIINKKGGQPRKYCSQRCKDRHAYLRNPQKYKDKADRWSIENREKVKKINAKAVKRFQENHKERYREIIKRTYEKNKNKWNCRVYTRMLLREGSITLIPECKECGTKEKIQIHHEIYPRTKKEIIKAVRDGKIYYLCLEHHNEIRRTRV